MRGLLPLLLTAAWASNPLFCPDQTVTITLDFSGIKYKNDGSTLRSEESTKREMEEAAA